MLADRLVKERRLESVRLDWNLDGGSKVPLRDLERRIP